jgi:hemolysin-activating ACP:hemolysin acyltransferase
LAGIQPIEERVAKSAKKPGAPVNGEASKGPNGSPPPAAATTTAADQTVEASADPFQDPEVAAKVAALRAQVRENFGKVVMTMMMLPRYRHQTLGDLQHLVLEPLIRDRIAIAYPGDKDRHALTDVVGFAIWASVSEEVDAAIREQIKAGAFPIRLKPEAWNSGSINWLFDVIAPNRKLTASVIANFKQVVKDGSLHLHPLVTRLVDPETLQKMGAEKTGAAKPAPSP